MCERLYSVNSAAKLLDVGRKYVTERIKAGEIHAINIAKNRLVYRIRAEELWRFVGELEAKDLENPNA